MNTRLKVTIINRVYVTSCLIPVHLNASKNKKKHGSKEMGYEAQYVFDIHSAKTKYSLVYIATVN